MFENFSHPEKWDIINFQLKKELACLGQVRAYINPFIATHDLLVSLAQLYAHKRSVAWVSGVSPLLENSQPYFVRESYQIQTLKMDEIKSSLDQGQSLIDKLNKDTLFLVFFKDHALSGEMYEYEKIQEWATAKRIIFILVSHEFTHQFNLASTSMGIQVAAPDLSLVYLPERTKLNSALGAYQNLKWQNHWSGIFKSILNVSPDPAKSNLELSVRSWESAIPYKKWPFKEQRSWNQSLIFFDSLHGDLIVQKLKEKGFENVRSYSDCVSNSPKSIRKWMVPEISDEELRGLTLFSFKDESHLPPVKLIEDIIENIKSESSWSF